MEREDLLYKKRHSMAHVMAEALLELFPDAKLAIGPPIKDGFYYDFEVSEKIKIEDLEKIENIMRKILKSKAPFIKEVLSKERALDLFKNQPYKIELIENLKEDEEISIYKSNNFMDLCRGPHVKTMKELDPKSFCLSSIAGAYWRGDERNPMLQRIYGILFSSESELKNYLNLKEERKKRDHRKLSKELELYSTHEEAGPGLIYWHPKGARVRVELENFWREEHFKNGYEMLFTPHIGKSWLWQKSGHLDFYRESMFNPIEMDKSDYFVKPMNCPFHIMIYNSKKHSYKNLPLRWAELGTVYRYEKIGALHGTMRVRGFTQDDAHIICSARQVENEIKEVLKFSLFMWESFGFKKLKAYISTRPQKYVGRESDWEKAEEALEKALKDLKMEYEIDEGGGAFYGPKIDLKIQDSLERDWQMSTVQFDFNLPEKFDMTFINEEGKEERPYMVHRALLGSIERFFGVLIEHYAGAFPIWLSPIQAVIIPVNNEEALLNYANELLNLFRSEKIRIESDTNPNSRMNAKIREHQAKKVPFMFILGEKEREGRTISIRTRENEQINNLKIEEVLRYLKEKINNKE